MNTLAKSDWRSDEILTGRPGRLMGRQGVMGLQGVVGWQGMTTQDAFLFEGLCRCS